MQSKLPRWIKLVFAACLALTGFLDRSTVAAHQHHRYEENNKKDAEPAPPAGPMFFVISTARQRVSVYGNGELYATAPVSTGRRDHPTPTGIFTIIQKERFHRSNLYSDAPMPYMQRITWSGVAMHEGVLPGYPASHGCIRLPHSFAKRMYGYTQGNERVIISRQDIVPSQFSHPNLPKPKLMALPGSDVASSSSAHLLQNALSTVRITGGADDAGKLDVAVKAEEKAPSAQDVQKLLNPVEFAKSMKARENKRAENAAAAQSHARGAVQAKVKEIREAAFWVRKARIALENAEDRAESANRRYELHPGGEDIEGVLALLSAKAVAEAKVKDAEAVLAEAQRKKSEKEQDEEAALNAYKDAENLRKAAADSAKSWNRRLAPLSVFISRKTQHLYVRQGFVKVFDVAVTIRDPDKPLGTHLFIAMQPEQAGEASLHWLSLSMPGTGAGSKETRHRRRYYEDDDEVDNAPRATPSVPAAEALDRIEIPGDAESKISEMLWAGSTLILSDSGISSETGEGTDFVILTR